MRLFAAKTTPLLRTPRIASPTASRTLQGAPGSQSGSSGTQGEVFSMTFMAFYTGCELVPFYQAASSMAFMAFYTGCELVPFYQAGANNQGSASNFRVVPVITTGCVEIITAWGLLLALCDDYTVIPTRTNNHRQ
jgi:hypothetical protein